MHYVLMVYDEASKRRGDVLQLSSTTPFGAISVGDLFVAPELPRYSHELRPGDEYLVTKVRHCFFESEHPTIEDQTVIEHIVEITIKKTDDKSDPHAPE